MQKGGGGGMFLSLKSLSEAGDEVGVFRVSLKPFLLCRLQNCSREESVDTPPIGSLMVRPDFRNFKCLYHSR